MAEANSAPSTPRPESLAPRALAITLAMLLVAVVTGALVALRDVLDVADVAMTYLVAIAVVASRLGRLPSLVASVFSVLALDWFFVPPLHEFRVEDLRHVITFAVLLAAGVTIAALTEAVRRSATDARRQASRADEEELRSSILSTLSHDLRTPLAVITGAASALHEAEMRLEPSARAELVRTIGEESARIERLIQNVLEMSRLEGAASIHKEWVPVEEVVGSALTRCEARLEGRAVKTTLPVAPWRIAVDPVLFENVLVNLLDNAAKHTPAGTPIEVSIAREGPALVLDVADRGVGVAPADAGLVFEKFQRGRSEARGAGLGLAISRAIVLAHGGTIRVHAREGGGAVFRITLPSFDAGEEALEAAMAATGGS